MIPKGWYNRGDEERLWGLQLGLQFRDGRYGWASPAQRLLVMLQDWAILSSPPLSDKPS